MGLGRSDATLRYRLMPSARSEMKSAMRDLGRRTEPQRYVHVPFR